MKSRKAAVQENGDGVTHQLAAKAATAKHLADLAKKHFKLLKAEFKQARKAYKQARKAAKRARKEAREAMKLLKPKQETVRRVTVARKAKKAPVQRRTQTATTSAIPLPTPPAPDISTATA
jgi:hypothetical protein